ncbi:VanZ family protein [Singulisphaera sp. PoT]|uniref:VanZ family protein n=1 Tax=Singulisphaera sp. PoT TaxID=3411797 RepID=UPI003BF551A3
MRTSFAGPSPAIHASGKVHFAFSGVEELRKNFLAVLLFSYGLFVAYLTLIFHTTQRLSLDNRFNLVAFRTVNLFLHKGGTEMLINVVGNLAVFIPVGFLIPLIRRNRTGPWFVVGLSAALSLLIEILQFCTGYRVADIDDVLLNTVSGALGYALFRAVYWIMLRSGMATDP